MPHRRTSRSRSRRSTQDWTQLLNLVTSLTAIGALVFTGLSLQATREELDIAQTVQITERFTRAVEHLGDEETMDVRLGAVLALERIARDSAADREAVGQLLTAFVRRKRPADESCVQGIGREHADVGAALRVLSSGQLTVAPDLSHTCLSGVDLRAARLRCAQLVGANLTGTTSLSGADLRHANLSNARLSGVSPDDPAPVATDLTRADLGGAQLDGADLSHAYLLGTNLRGADLSDATLTDAHLEGADLRGAHLMEANLHGADLSRARLKGAHISGSTFGSPAARADAIEEGAVDDVGFLTAQPCGR